MTIEEKLDLIIKKLTVLEDEIVNQKNFNTKKDVAIFLNVTSRTVTNYIKNGTFINGVHYVYRNDKLYFISKAIYDYKVNPITTISKDVIDDIEYLNPIASNIVKDLIA